MHSFQDRMNASWDKLRVKAENPIISRINAEKKSVVNKLFFLIQKIGRLLNCHHHESAVTLKYN